jgi:biopolymer transport protein ExbD
MFITGCATSHSTSSTLPRDAVCISIAADGTFYLSDIFTLRPNGTPYGRGEHLDLAVLSARLKELGAEHPNLLVGIGVAKETKHQQVTAATKACSSAGLKDIEIWTSQ